MDPLVWPAHWISPGAHPREDLGVFGFRVRLELASVPSSLMVRVSADQRYKLYVNGEMVVFGPQRGDEKHWFYETVALAPFLNEGENWIAVLVWNFGRWAPMAQRTVRTGFVFCCVPPSLASASEEEEGAGGGGQSITQILNTPGEWQVMRIPGWDFEMMHSSIGDFYIDVGPGEISRSGDNLIDGVIGEPGKHLAWTTPHVICQAEERGASGGGTPWMLIPRSIPLMRYQLRKRAPRCRRGFKEDHESPYPEEGALLWPDNDDGFDGVVLKSGESLLFDYEELLCAFPRVFLACEGKATIRLTYCEALWEENGTKGERNSVTRKGANGYQDRIELDAWSVSFEPLWWRTYRFLLIEVSGDPVKLLAVDAIETGYPLEVESSFNADDPWVEKIWDVSVRTAKRCAGETYFDCPYYEQLQYVGDTRIQALIGYYLGRDRALQRNAVETLGWSIMDNGLTQSRYPSRQAQVIPPFSLWWVMMVMDQILYDRLSPCPWFDNALRVSDSWFLARSKGDRFWNFADWVPTWKWGVPPNDGKSALHYLVFALGKLTDGWIEFQRGLDAAEWFHELRRSYLKDFVQSKGLVEMNGIGSEASEHVEALYRLCQERLTLDPDAWPTEALAAANAAKCTYYFSYYKHLAMFGRPEVSRPSTFGLRPSDNPQSLDLHPQPPPPPGHKPSRQEEGARESDPRPSTFDLRQSDKPQSTIGNPQFDYLTELQPWKEMLENGLTTFAENPEPTRSDCHAWSAHPILGFFQIVAGVTSIAPGWKKARIMPHPGNLKRFDARIAHPDGELRVAYENETFTIDSPVPFEFRWRDKNGEYKEGQHKIG